MKVVKNPSHLDILKLLKRPELDQTNLDDNIGSIFFEIERAGDDALKEFSLKYDKVKLSDFLVLSNELEEAENYISDELKRAINIANDNIVKFHKNQIVREQVVETTKGVKCWRESKPIQNVGLYIPGGSAPLFSTVLMLGVPANLAGVPRKIICTPPNGYGKIHPAIAYAAKVAGIDEIYKIGGAQAIAAMTLGTESIQKVDKIVGPGNQFVTAAKKYAQKLGVSIDLPAGPSEVLVAADDTIPANIIASDLLAQAEHGADSHVVFLTDSSDLIDKVLVELKHQLKQIPRAEIAIEALNQSVCILETVDKWATIINEYAPEHLIVMGKYEQLLEQKVVNAGSVFLGVNSAESFGDYASGTNHTLPTFGFAKAYSGVSVDTFVKKITYQRINDEGLRNLGPTVIQLAKAESLEAHANSIVQRLSNLEHNSEVKKTNVVSESLFRTDLQNIVPYQSARDEFTGTKAVFLDANENALANEYSRYPDPHQIELKNTIAEIKNVSSENLFLGNGSDEVLDLIMRLTCVSNVDSIAILDPTYGMYSILAKLNGLDVVKISLDRNFQVEVDVLLKQAKNSKILIICNPNNPTGKIINKAELLKIIRQFEGIVVVDEAYVDFCECESLIDEINNFENLIIVQTLSKAFGMAGLRIGMALANSSWVKALDAIKPPYNISSISQQKGIELLRKSEYKNNILILNKEKIRVQTALEKLPIIEHVYPSLANFLLFRITNASLVYKYLSNHGVVVRDRSSHYQCENTLRVSIGTPDENDLFIDLMNKL